MSIAFGMTLELNKGGHQGRPDILGTYVKFDFRVLNKILYEIFYI